MSLTASNRFFVVLVTLFLSSFCLDAQDLYSPNSVPTLKIYFERTDWELAMDSLKQAGKKERMNGKVNLNGKSFEEVGIRFKGNSSYNSARNIYKRKLPLNVKLNQVNKAQKFLGQIGSVKLANGFRDPSFVREILSYEIARKYMPAPRCNFMNVSVNDTPYGFYSNTESINDDFVERLFKSDSIGLIKCDVEERVKAPKTCPKNDGRGTMKYLGKDSFCYQNIYEIKEGEKVWPLFQTFLQKLNSKPAELEAIFNVDQALWMLAFNNVLVNLDSYSGRLSHNYYLAIDPNGRLHPIIWDLNLSFGGFRFKDNKEPLSNEKMQKLSPFTHYKNPEKPLISKLLSVARYRKTYIAHMQTILKENFANGDYLRRAKSIQSSIDFYVKKDENKFYSYQAFKQNLNQSTKAGKVQIIGVEELMKARVTYLEAHPLLKKKAPSIQKPFSSRQGENVTIKSTVKDATLVEFAYREKPFQAFTRVKMEVNQTGSYSITLALKRGSQYYIYAENEKTASLSPARAEFEFHELR